MHFCSLLQICPKNHEQQPAHHLSFSMLLWLYCQIEAHAAQYRKRLGLYLIQALRICILVPLEPHNSKTFVWPAFFIPMRYKHPSKAYYCISALEVCLHPYPGNILRVHIPFSYEGKNLCESQIHLSYHNQC